MSEQLRRLVTAMQAGLPFTPRPYRAIGNRIGMSEAETIRRVRDGLREGAIKRFGVVVRHHELGFRDNAMVVWDVPDARVDALGDWLGNQTGVTLCYRRPRQPPHWPYNLFCMIHGRNRDDVRERIQALSETDELAGIPHAVLFSRRRFKQRGARYGFDDARGRNGDA
ncbi:MAG TPA: AsnC family protein [Gammaproteobacteria bacterium]|nr:AsnC family protein [Gammaproteobacteria bacterium]